MIHDATDLYIERGDGGAVMQVVMKVGHDKIVASLEKEVFISFVMMATRLARDDAFGLDNSETFCYIPKSKQASKRGMKAT